MTYRALEKCNGSGKRKEVRLVSGVPRGGDSRNVESLLFSLLDTYRVLFQFCFPTASQSKITDKKKKKKHIAKLKR